MIGSGDRLSRTSRLVLASFAVAVLAVLITARWLRPDPQGFGTHTQLGLPPCSFRVLTGYPCPACGMTTAFAWTLRGRLDRAFFANPGGAVMAPLCFLTLPWLLFAAITGHPRPFRSAEVPLVAAALGIVAVALLSWAVRLFWMVR